MSIDNSKMKNLKALYEQRRERITHKITEINLTEYTIRQYNNLKHKFGITEGICVFGLVFIISGCILKNTSATLLLSSSMGFTFVSVYNALKYSKMKKLKEENPNIDFHNYDFNSNQNELDKLFQELFSIDNCLLNPVENENQYLITEKEKIKIYEPEIKIQEETFEYSGYEILENKKLEKVKKKGRR